MTRLPPLHRLLRWNFWRRVPLRLAVHHLKLERGRASPEKVQIEATSRCNLLCPSCSHSREGSKGHHLSEDDLQEILDAFPSPPERVILSGIGEPLVNPHFIALVDHLATRGIQCVFFTNGTLLSERMRGAILSRHNIEEICISCDGATKSTFETLRFGADFEKWKQSVAIFLAEAKRRGKALRTVANVVVSRQNLAEVRQIIHLTAELGFGAVNLMEPVPVDEVTQSLCPSPNDMAAISESELFALGRRLGLRVSTGFRRGTCPPKSMVRCLQPWEYVFIRSNGDVYPCAAIFGSGKAAVVGNVFEDTLAGIWGGNRFREFRRSSALGTNSLCQICPYY